MSTPILVARFYDRIWNAGDFRAIETLITEDFVFRGSLGSERVGKEAFADYVRLVRGALSSYHCQILECLAEDGRAFAKMHFSGLHAGEFRGYAPTGLKVHWLGAALFRFEQNKIGELWVLGDLSSLDALLARNAETT